MALGIVGKLKYGKKRSPKWTEVRKQHLEKNPECAICGSIKKVEVHHVKPFHLYPELELEPSNLVSLCESKEFSSLICHLDFGHLGNYQDENAYIFDTIVTMKEIFRKRKEQQNINKQEEINVKTPS